VRASFIFSGSKVSTTILKPNGSINSATADEFKAAINATLPTTRLIIDLTGVDYISSAGLRILLWANGQFAPKVMVVTHVWAEVQDVFQMTGFSGILTIE
jgi:Anti-anti-sigma regulatory factor (antagonist of anti-sigma factor)